VEVLRTSGLTIQDNVFHRTFAAPWT
jgi:hypothetical protein